MLDNADILISTNTETSELQNVSPLNLMLCFSLKNGNVKILLHNDIGVAYYYDNSKELLKEIEFNDLKVDSIMGSFNLALKAIFATDKQNKQLPFQSNTSIGDSEMDKLRSQLSGIN